MSFWLLQDTTTCVGDVVGGVPPAPGSAGETGRRGWGLSLGPWGPGF